MSILLHIECSPRKERSASIEVAHAFIDAYRQSHPRDVVKTMDIWSADLPAFDGETIAAKYRILHGQSHTPSEAAAWEAVVRTIDEFKIADKFVISAPMWNFGIPYRLKHYLDVIIQPGLTFSFSPQTGYSGLVKGKPVVLLLSRGGSYEGPAAAYDMQKPYLEGAMKFIGFEDIRTLTIDPCLGAPADVEAVVKAATRKAAELAGKL